MEQDGSGYEASGDGEREEPGDAATPELRRSWVLPRPDRAAPPVVAHWVDERGSVVRLISSDGSGSSTGAPRDGT